MKKIRYGIIGFGGFAEQSILPAMRKSGNSELVAIQKRSLEQAKKKAQEYSIPLYFDSVDSLVGSPEIDAVFIVSSNAQHHRETLAAAHKGKHVLVEKPMSVTFPEAEEMVAACEKANVKFMVAHMVRFSPAIRRVKEIVSSGMLGEISYARSEFYYNAAYSRRRWIRDRKEAGGGPWFDIGVHCLDTMRFVLDADVTRVTGLMRNETSDTTESTSIVGVEMSGRILGTIYTSFETGHRNSLLEIIGSKGVVRIRNFTLSNCTPTVVTETADNGDIQKVTEEEITVPDLYTLEISHFSDCILNNTQPVISSESSLHNQFILGKALALVNEK